MGHHVLVFKCLEEIFNEILEKVFFSKSSIILTMILLYSFWKFSCSYRQRSGIIFLPLTIKQKYSVKGEPLTSNKAEYC